jgi:hypothetical protein
MRWKPNPYVVYALASLIIYMAAVCAVGQHLVSQYNGEQFILAAATSHTVFGTEIGAAPWSFIKQIVLHEGTMQQAIAAARDSPSHTIAPNVLWTTMPDGLGVVMVTIVSVLFRLFGATLAVFPALAIGVSAYRRSVLLPSSCASRTSDRW